MGVWWVAKLTILPTVPPAIPPPPQTLQVAQAETHLSETDDNEPPELPQQFL